MLTIYQSDNDDDELARIMSQIDKPNFATKTIKALLEMRSRRPPPGLFQSRLFFSLIIL